MNKVLLSLAIAWSCVGCAPDDGDYTFYVVAFGETDRSPGCYGELGPTPDQIEDSSTFLGWDYLSTFAVEDTYFLNVTDFVLEGTLEDDTFDFQSEYVDVQYSGPEDDTRTEFVRINHFRFTRTGETITGTVVADDVEQCEGPGCLTTAAQRCTRTNTLQGREIGGSDTTVPLDLQTDG